MNETSISGLAVYALADAFRLMPTLDENSLGRQLRDWRDGKKKTTQETQRKILEKLCAELFAGVEGPLTELNDEEDPDVLAAGCVFLLLHWCNWLDGLEPPTPDDEGMELLLTWIIEHTLNLFGVVLGISRFGWGLPLADAPQIEDWFPSGFDEHPLQAKLLDEVFADLDLQAKESGLTLEKLVEAQRYPDEEPVDVPALKRSTVDRWRTGKSRPNGENFAALQRVTQDAGLRLKYGVAWLAEQLASTRRDNVSATETPAEQRNVAMLLMMCAERKAFAVQKSFLEGGMHPAAAVLSLVLPEVLDSLLPVAIDAAAPLPFNLKKREALIVELRQGQQRGKIAVLK